MAPELVQIGRAVVALAVHSLGANQARDITAGELPAEARQTLRLINQGGPFPYRRDGVVFGNYERRLPQRPRGYYREYTVPTPGGQGRGAQRIILGASDERYYTPDHYRHFLRVQP
ncbi:MAG: ribonuclease [Rhodocyclaceae bacterium]|nr:MAG: ribonuclease [Rhodocyclaceae bacterium]